MREPWQHQSICVRELHKLSPTTLSFICVTFYREVIAEHQRYKTAKIFGQQVVCIDVSVCTVVYWEGVQSYNLLGMICAILTNAVSLFTALEHWRVLEIMTTDSLQQLLVCVSLALTNYAHSLFPSPSLSFVLSFFLCTIQCITSNFTIENYSGVQGTGLAHRWVILWEAHLSVTQGP